MKGKPEIKAVDREPDLVIASADICLYVPETQVAVRGVHRKWGRRQFSVLALLAEHVDQLLARDFIYDNIWAHEFYNHMIVPVTIHAVRSHLGAPFSDPKTGAIRNRREAGYMAISEM